MKGICSRKSRFSSSPFRKMQQKWDILSNPDIHIVVLKGTTGHEDRKATVFWDKKTKEVYLHAGSLPEAPEGRQYQIWALVDGKPVNAGMYAEQKGSQVPLSVVPRAQDFAVTLEKSGGTASPTMTNMYMMGFVDM